MLDLYQFDRLNEKIEKLKQELAASQMALMNTHATLNCVLKQGEALLALLSTNERDDVKDACNVFKSELEHYHDSGYLDVIRVEAFSRGFEEGYVFKRLERSDNTSPAEAYEQYKNRPGIQWRAISSVRYRAQLRPSEPVRYVYDSESEDEKLGISHTGDLMEYSDYAELRFKYDILQQECAGYRLAFHAVAEHSSPKIDLNQVAKNKVRKPRSPGLLKLQYGQNRRERDLFVLWGEGVPRCDSALVFHAFSAKRMEFNYKESRPYFHTSLIEEFAARGYDLSTLRFSIQKKLDPLDHKENK